MKNSVLKNIFKNRLNYVIILLIVVLGATILIGTSFYFGISNFWRDFTTKSYDFDLLMVFVYDEVDKNEFMNVLRKNGRIKDVFEYNEYRSYAVFDDYVNDDINGEVSLVGTTNNTKKIIYGKDLDDQSEGMICPSGFLPDSLIYSNGKYDVKNVIDLKNMINKNMNISYIGKYDVSIPLIGIFDSYYDYSEPNVCYVSHATMRNLNNLYQQDLTNEGTPILVLVDDIKDADDILNYSEISSYSETKRLNTEIGNQVLLTTGTISAIATFLVIIIIYLVYSRRVIKEYRNIGIMMIVGYNRKEIKKKFYIEGSIIYLISSAIYLLISYYITSNFVKWFLSNRVFLSLIKIKVNILLILVCLFFVGISIFLAIYTAMKKIDKLDIQDIIYE